MEGIGNRVKFRSKVRLFEINKRKKTETPLVHAVKKRRRRQRKVREDHDTDVEDVTPVFNNTGFTSPPTESFRCGSQGNVSVKESLSRVFRDLGVDRLGPSSSKLRVESEQNKCAFRVTDLGAEKESVPGYYFGLRDASEGSSCLKKRSFEDVAEKQVQNSYVSEQNVPLKDKSSETRGLDTEKSIPGYYFGLRDSSEGSSCLKKRSFEDVAEKRVQNSYVSEPNVPLKDKSSETRGLDTEKSIPVVVEIPTDSESDIELKASAKKKLFGKHIVESSDEENDASETEAEQEETKDSDDDVIVDSLSFDDQYSSSSSLMSSSSSSSSSSSDDEFNLEEVVEDTNCDDLKKTKVSTVERPKKPVGRPKKYSSSLTKPRKVEAKKIQKPNSPEVEEEEELKDAEIVSKQPINVVFTCLHCGKENTGIPESLSSGIRPQGLRNDYIEYINNFASTSVSKCEDFVSVNVEKSPELEKSDTGKEVSEKTSRPEIQSSEKVKEVQVPVKTSRHEVQSSEKVKQDQTNMKIPEVAEGLNTSDVDNEQIDVESDSSDTSSDESGYESETSLKDKANDNSDWKLIDGNSKEDLLRLLKNSVGDKREEVELESSHEDQSQEQVSDLRIYDDDGLFIIRPPPPITNWRFGVKEPSPPPMMTEEEREKEELWEQLAFSLKSNEDSNEILSNIDQEMVIDESVAARCRKGDHELEVHLEIGMKCIHCGYVETEIRDMDTAQWAEKIFRGRRKNDRYDEEDNSSFVGNFGFEAFNKNSSNEGCSSAGTVWDKIPGVKSQMYPHQQEGFEFIWKNLAGTIMLNELKDFENSEETGGCIMSHAPGTGKTRLTIMFLQAYLECFPNCKPVIIAPASLLLTWAEEFRKWNITIPFHNLNNLEFSGKESSEAMELLMKKNLSDRNHTEIRIVKLYSWKKSRSILGISYSLYEKYAGVRKVDKKTKKVKTTEELEIMRKILIREPGLLVLDEAHTPRNQRSCIWKTLSNVETQKRILLSGTPFQNNFQELCNVLGLARPKYTERLTSTLKKSGMTKARRGKGALGDEINKRGIEELKTVMFPFVHVHKGSILQKSLPGLRECVVVLNPPELQKKVLESIEVTYNSKTINVFETEHKLSLVSVHPSLVSRCKLSERERLSIDDALIAQLKAKKLDPNQSVKTKFLMEFIGYCQVKEEKVLVFSQYIDPLKLIMKHLVKRFNWNTGEEVLYMHGKLEQKQRQFLINEFNDPRSKAKVFLASTKACSEGINLVGASRVILLDVVWNPAVERQAISRAYRIGQKRIVYTYHLVAKGTPEGPKYCKQAQKDRISELVFACSSKHEKGNEKNAEVVIEDQILDTMVKHSKLGDMFDNLIVQPKESDLVEGFNILMP